MPALVKFGVVRQIALRHDAKQLSVIDNRGAVVKLRTNFDRYAYYRNYIKRRGLIHYFPECRH